MSLETLYASRIFLFGMIILAIGVYFTGNWLRKRKTNEGGVDVLTDAEYPPETGSLKVNEVLLNIQAWCDSMNLKLESEGGLHIFNNTNVVKRYEVSKLLFEAVDILITYPYFDWEYVSKTQTLHLVHDTGGWDNPENIKKSLARGLTEIPESDIDLWQNQYCVLFERLYERMKPHLKMTSLFLEGYDCTRQITSVNHVICHIKNPDELWQLYQKYNNRFGEWLELGDCNQLTNPTDYGRRLFKKSSLADYLVSKPRENEPVQFVKKLTPSEQMRYITLNFAKLPDMVIRNNHDEYKVAYATDYYPVRKDLVG